MRRTLGFVLTALLSYPLIAPFILASEDSNLPACCRRNGQHHCSMGADTLMDGAGPATGVAFHAAVSRCPDYPVATGSSAESKFLATSDSQAIFAAIVSHPAVQAQTEARYRVSFSRSHHKRGPPAFTS